MSGRRLNSDEKSGRYGSLAIEEGAINPNNDLTGEHKRHVGCVTAGWKWTCWYKDSMCADWRVRFNTFYVPQNSSGESRETE